MYQKKTGRAKAYHDAVYSTGEFHPRWIDKPHRVVIDASDDIQELTDVLRGLLSFAEDVNSRLPPPSNKEDLDKGIGCNQFLVPIFKTTREVLNRMDNI